MMEQRIYWPDDETWVLKLVCADGWLDITRRDDDGRVYCLSLPVTELQNLQWLLSELDNVPSGK